jgi:hypothetical protein
MYNIVSKFIPFFNDSLPLASVTILWKHGICPVLGGIEVIGGLYFKIVTYII